MANKPEETKQTTEVPSALNDKDIKTKVTTLKQVIEDTMLKIEDIASAEIMMDVTARMRERLKSIKKMSSAVNLKIQGHWKTKPPEMHIRNPVGKKLSNTEARITFEVYATDKAGNKLGFENKVKVETESGRIIEKVTSVDYRIAFEVTEMIKMGKPITREVMKLNEV